MKLLPESGNKRYTVADAGWSLAAHTQLPYACVAAVQRGKITFNRQLFRATILFMVSNLENFQLVFLHW